MKNKRQYFYNGLLLTFVALLMRTAAVSFNVYVSNRVGAEAMGLLALISGVYGFAVTLATSGIHLATVRTVAARMEETHGAENGRCLAACLSYAGFFGTLATVLLLTFARPIGIGVLHDARTVRSLRMLSFTLIPIALTSVLNGYFTAVRRAFKNACAQVAEQAVKIAFTTYLLTAAAPRTTEGAVLAILLGGAVSESLSLVFNLVLYLFDRRRFAGLKAPENALPIRPARIALPVAVSAYVRSGLLTIEHILIPFGIRRHGADNVAALAAYGTLHSMALPVVLYPAAVLSSFSALLIPEITEEQSTGNRTEIRYIAGRVYQISLLFSIGTAGVMLCLSGELGRVLYGSGEVAYFIRRLAPLVPVMYLDTATDAMLKGLGEQVYSMNVNIIDALVSVLSVAVLVPIFGINGYLVTIYLTEILNAALSVCRLLRVSGYRPRVGKLVFLPLAATVGATCAARICFRLLPPLPLTPALTLTAHVTATVLFYFLLLAMTGVFSGSDARWLVSCLLPPRRRKI